jgi:hypothetical protein
MIAQDKTNGALKAVQHLCIISRFQAGDLSKSDSIFGMMDIADHLLNLMLALDDRTETFRRSLEDSIPSVPQCKECLRLFNQDDSK